MWLTIPFIVTPSNERVICNRQHVHKSSAQIMSSLTTHKTVGLEYVASRFRTFLQSLSFTVPAVFFKKLASHFLVIGTVPDHDKSRLFSSVSSYARERNPLTFKCTQASISTKRIHRAPVSAM